MALKRRLGKRVDFDLKEIDDLPSVPATELLVSTPRRSTEIDQYFSRTRNRYILVKKPWWKRIFSKQTHIEQTLNGEE